MHTGAHTEEELKEAACGAEALGAWLRHHWAWRGLETRLMGLQVGRGGRAPYALPQGPCGPASVMAEDRL